MKEYNLNKQKDLPYILLLCVISLGFGFYSVYLGIDSENDSYNYHFYNGFAFINNRTFVDMAPAGLHSYFNPFLDVLVYLGITNLPQKIYSFLLGSIQGFNILPVYFIAKKIFSQFAINRILILITSFICLLQSLFLTQLGVSMHDSLTSLFILISFSLFIYYYTYNITLGFYIPSLILGAIVGLKLTSAIYGLSFAFLIGIYAVNRKQYMLLVYSGLCMLAGFLLTNGWWMYQLWSHFENPFYPYFNNVFKSPLAVTNSEAYIDKYFFRQKGLQHLFYPIFFSNEPGLASGYFGWPLHSFYREVVAYLLTILVLISMLSKKWRARRESYLNETIYLLFIFCFVGYVIWYLKFGVMRYLMPTLLLCPIIIIFSIFLLGTERIKSKLIGFISFNNLIYSFLLIFCVCLTREDLKNGFPMDAHKPITEGSFVLENNLIDYDNKATIYFITGTPRVWQAWVFPALNLQGVAIPLKSGIFKYENDNLYNKRITKVNEILNAPGSYAIVIRDLTGQGWISKATSDEETNEELKRYNLKLSTDCREYDSGFGSNIHRLKFCNVEKL